MTSPLKSPRLRRIIVAYTVNRLGTWFGLVALMLAVFDHTHSAVAVAVLLFSGQALPAFLVPAVVARVEGSRHRGRLSRLYFFEAVATAGLAVLLWHFWLPAVLLLAALDGTAALAASALLRAQVARTARAQIEPVAGANDRVEDVALPSEQVIGGTAGHDAERKANAVLNVAFSVTFVLGPALAGAVVAAAGGPAALFIDVGSFLVCGVLLIDLRPHVEETGEGSVRARLRAAWRHINEAPPLRRLLLADAMALVFFQASGPIEVPYIKVTLHAGDRGFGLLLAIWGAGTVVGSVVFARSLRRPLGGLLSAGTLAVGLAYVGLAIAPSLAFAYVAALLGGIGNGVEVPSLISVVQRLTPQNLHGRLMGAVESIAALCIAIGLPLGGGLVALSSPRIAFLVVGLGAMATSTALFRLSRGNPEGTDSGLSDTAASVSATNAAGHLSVVPADEPPEDQDATVEPSDDATATFGESSLRY